MLDTASLADIGWQRLRDWRPKDEQLFLCPRRSVVALTRAQSVFHWGQGVNYPVGTW